MRTCIRFWRPCLIAALIALAVSSACSRKFHNASNFASIYGRAQVYFTNASLLKPSEANSAGSVGYKFAPLIMQEVLDTNCLAETREVFFYESKASLNGRSYQQIAYVWEYPHGASQPGGMQGVRMTLNSAGLPVIWEVLCDASGADIIFASQSVEAAALGEFGPPLPERRFAVERSMTDAPGVVVARVIEDGPVPMGPIVYLRAGTQDVSTVICRCMNAQAKTLTGTAEFTLISGASQRFFRGRKADGSSLEQRLRLPRNL